LAAGRVSDSKMGSKTEWEDVTWDQLSAACAVMVEGDGDKLVPSCMRETILLCVHTSPTAAEQAARCLL
jgi:hypothetical protein